jgi:CSLREA domain-containing protein
MAGMALHKSTWVERTRTIALWLLALLVATFIGVLLTIKPAHAATFVVNRTADTPDANLANAACDSNASQAGNQCTLRAAIQEANDTAGEDQIRFNIVSAAGSSLLAPVNV